jgi:hypothetical protein
MKTLKFLFCLLIVLVLNECRIYMTSTLNGLTSLSYVELRLHQASAIDNFLFSYYFQASESEASISASKNVRLNLRKSNTGKWEQISADFID